MRSNYRAARHGRSRAEFIAKLGVVFEEIDECVDHLEYLRDARILESPELINESRELTAIFAKSLKTAKANASRTKVLPRS